MDLAIADDQLWMIVVGFIVAFGLAFGIGANDVANSFGTSVGSKVLTLKQACILASIFETLGSVLLGAKVSDTIRKGVISVELYQNNTELLMAGNIAALSGSCVWLLAATLLRLPVSATHSIVGATVGFALVNHGIRGIQWIQIILIVGSWFVSPLLAGLVSTGIFFLCKFLILSKEDPLEPGLRLLPLFYGLTVVVNVFSVFYEGPEMLHFDRIPLWGTFILSFGAGILCAIFVRLCLVPYQRKHIRAGVQKLKEETITSTESSRVSCSSSSGFHISEKDSLSIEKESVSDLESTDPQITPCDEQFDQETEFKLESKTQLISSEYDKGTTGDELEMPTEIRNTVGDELEEGDEGTVTEKTRRDIITDSPETAKLFSFLQILTAIFGSFAHGGNDVSNAISPLITLWIISTTGMVGEKSMTPIWILIYGGVGISLGLCTLGRRVIKTMGEDLTKITPSSGFCIEIGSALTVLIASNVGVPISTTHCKVGSVVFVGRFRSRDNVDWSLFRNIVFAWLVTLPVTGAISAAIMALLRLIFI